MSIYASIVADFVFQRMRGNLRPFAGDILRETPRLRVKRERDLLEQCNTKFLRRVS
jgi:hypothetical protein